MVQLDDYLTLRTTGGNVDKSRASDGLITFYIPADYYSNSRGPICDVKLCQGNISININGNDSCLIQADLPISNCWNNDNTNFYVMGVLSSNINSMRIGENPTYRTNARPQKITLFFQSLDGSAVDVSDNTAGGVFVFKFSYENQEEAIESYNSGSYSTIY